MKLNETSEIYVWIAFVLFLLALGYLGTGGKSLLVLSFVIIFAIVIAIGIGQTMNELFKSYNTKKK